MRAWIGRHPVVTIAAGLVGAALLVYCVARVLRPQAAAPARTVAASSPAASDNPSAGPMPSGVVVADDFPSYGIYSRMD